MSSGREVRLWAALLAFFVLLAFATAACAGDGAGTARSSPAAIDGRPSLLLSDATKRLFQSSSDFQRTIAADGVLELDEYDRAALAMVACMKDRGFSTAQDPVPDALFTYHLVFEYGPGQLDAGRAAHQECFKEYFSEITMAWADFVAPDSARIFAEAEQAVVACYRERLSIRGSDSSSIEYPDAKEALYQGDRDAGDCFAQTKAEFNLPFWGG